MAHNVPLSSLCSLCRSGLLGFIWKSNIWCLCELMLCCRHVGDKPQFKKTWSWLVLAGTFISVWDNCGLRYSIPMHTLTYELWCCGNAAVVKCSLVGVTRLFLLVTECLIKITFWHGYLCLHSIKLWSLVKSCVHNARWVRWSANQHLVTL